MRRLTFILFAAGLCGLACNSAGKKSPGPSKPSGNNGPAPFWSEDRPAQLPESKGAAAETSSQGIIAGRLIDPSGQPQANAVVNVMPANAGPGAKPIGVQTDDQGFFIIKGLSAGTNYTLSARNEDRGRVLGATTVAQAPNTRMLIRLSEGSAPSVVQPPPTSGGNGGNGGAFVAPPAKKDEGKTKLADPKMSIPSPDPAPSRDPLTGSDHSWGPGKPPPAATPLPPPPATKKDNPNVADNGFRDGPPPAAIPGPFVAPAVEPPPPSSSPGMSAVPSNSSPLTGASAAVQPPQRTSFTLYDSAGNPVEFQNMTDRRLVVLDFWTTTCMPCLRKIPELIELQHRYANYVEVAGVACDDLPWAQRRKAVDGIKDYYLRKSPRPINYGIWYEGEGQEGRVQNQFKVKAYPTMILLDHNGREMWRGNDVRQLEDAIKYCLMRK